MFKSDAKLFISANNNLNYAKTLINECKRLVYEIVLNDNSDYKNIKNNIINCNIDGLEDKIETTKKSLLQLDQDFANEYMKLLQEYLTNNTIDTSKLTDEQMMQYNIKMSGYARDYNYTLLYMLEKYEDSGMLTPELEAQLEMQRTIVEQYDVQDKMAALPTTSNGYIELFKKNATYDRKIINLNPNLTDEQKSETIKEYDINFNAQLDILVLNRNISIKTEELKGLDAGTKAYYEKENQIYQLQINYLNNKGTLTDEEKQTLKELKNYKKLNNLYVNEIEVNSNWIPFDGNSYKDDICALKVDMGIATNSEIEYLNMNGFERFVENTGAFVGSTLEGVVKIEEQIFDGAVMLAGGFTSIFGSSKWAEDIVKFDIAGNFYSGFTSVFGINEEIAYGEAHAVGNFIGETTGTLLLQFISGGTAGTVVMVSAHALKGMGKASEEALNDGHSFKKALFSGVATGCIEGAASLVLYGKIHGKDVANIVGDKLVSAGAKVANFKLVKPVTNIIKNGAGKFSTLVKSGTSKISSLTGIGTGSVSNLAKHYANLYSNETFKTSLITKYLVAGGKEIGKWGTSSIIDGKFNTDELRKAMIESLAVTTINEFIVAPGAKIIGKNANKYAEQKMKSEAIDDVKEMLKGANADATRLGTASTIKELSRSITSDFQIRLAKATEAALASKFGNKFVKKISQEYIKNNAFADS